MTTSSRLGALALLAVGLDHLEQFSVGHYSVIPTIGTLFVLNFVSAIVIAGGLAVSNGKLRLLFGIGGLGVAGGSLAGLLISETVGLFGFTEIGYRPAIELSIALDVTTIALLSIFVVSAISSAGRAPRRACPTSAARPR